MLRRHLVHATTDTTTITLRSFVNCVMRLALYAQLAYQILAQHVALFIISCSLQQLAMSLALTSTLMSRKTLLAKPAQNHAKSA